MLNPIFGKGLASDSSCCDQSETFRWPASSAFTLHTHFETRNASSSASNPQQRMHRSRLCSIGCGCSGGWWLLLQRQLQRAQQSVTDGCMCRFTLLRARRTWDDTWNSRSHARTRIWFFLVASRTPRMLLANARRGNVPDRLRRSFGCGGGPQDLEA